MKKRMGFTDEEIPVNDSIYAELVGDLVSVLLPGNTTSIGRLRKTTERTTELCPVLIREDYIEHNETKSCFRIERTKPSIITTSAIVGMHVMSDNYLDSFERNRRNDNILYL